MKQSTQSFQPVWNVVVVVPVVDEVPVVLVKRVIPRLFQPNPLLICLNHNLIE